MKKILTPEEQQWLKENYPRMRNEDIARRLGVSVSWFFYGENRMGLRKDPEWAKSVRRNNGLNALKKTSDPDVLKRRGASLKKAYTLERTRVLYGMPQETKLRVSFSKRQRWDERYKLKKRGYVIDEEKQIAYYTPKTRRLHKLEAQPKTPYGKHPQFYTFAELPKSAKTAE